MKTIECSDELIDKLELFRDELKQELMANEDIQAVFIFNSYLPWFYQKLEPYQFQLRSLINIVVDENTNTEYFFRKYYDYLRNYILKLGIYININIITTKNLLTPMDEYDYNKYFFVNSTVLFDKSDICQSVPLRLYYPQLTKDEPCTLIRRKKYYR